MTFPDQEPGNRRSFFDTFRYVEDFKTETVTDEKGRLRKKAVYIGTWNVFRDTGTKTLVKLVGSAVLSAAAVVSELAIVTLNHGFGGNLVVMAPFLVQLFPLFYLLMGAAALPYGRRPMRRDQYMHGMIRMQRSSVAVITFSVVGSIAALIFRIVRGDWLFLKNDILFPVYTLLLIICCVGILLLLGSIDIYEMPNGYIRSKTAS